MDMKRVKVHGSIVGLLRFCTEETVLWIYRMRSELFLCTLECVLLYLQYILQSLGRLCFQFCSWLHTFHMSSPPYNRHQQFKECWLGEVAHKYMMESCVFPWETLRLNTVRGTCRETVKLCSNMTIICFSFSYIFLSVKSLNHLFTQEGKLSRMSRLILIQMLIRSLILIEPFIMTP